MSRVRSELKFKLEFADPYAEEGQEEQELKPEDWKLSEAELRLLHWHWANLEYGCSAPLNAVSLAHWNQVRS